MFFFMLRQPPRSTRTDTLVPYTTRCRSQVKKLVKQIGQELMQDPEQGPHILETLKMQGVEQFGDFAVQIRMKMMTKPGEQFVIRRRAYRSEEHTSELQSLMRISYAVFCLKKKQNHSTSYT